MLSDTPTRLFRADHTYTHGLVSEVEVDYGALLALTNRGLEIDAHHGSA
jgi:hypothetical protein